MPGLNLAAYTSGASGGQPTRFGNTPSPSSATEAAFGTGVVPNANAGLTPTAPVGLAFWTGVIAVVGLVIIYRSLPG